jgi:hypothetical protein
MRGPIATNRPSEQQDMRTRVERIASLDRIVMVTPDGGGGSRSPAQSLSEPEALSLEGRSSNHG